MSKAILFPGRFAPFHAGHRAVVEELLVEGREVVILVRDTPINGNNPFTMAQRIAMIANAFHDEDRVKVREIDDFDWIVHGRQPGWSVREVSVDADTERLSATSLRGGHVIWIMGESGAGKTTLAKVILRQLPSAINLDGDDMRLTISRESGFSTGDRMQHNKRVARLARLLRDQGHIVIVSVIAPTMQIRKQVDRIVAPFWIYLARNPHLGDPEYVFEEPDQREIGRLRMMSVDNRDRSEFRTADVAWPYILSEIS